MQRTDTYSHFLRRLLREQRGGGLSLPPPNETACPLQTAMAAAILWNVEFTTS
jgi:hypothetical protein